MVDDPAKGHNPMCADRQPYNAPERLTLSSEPQSVDPDILDMGARQDGLTPRQRPRRDPDADE